MYEYVYYRKKRRARLLSSIIVKKMYEHVYYRKKMYEHVYYRRKDVRARLLS